VLARGRMIETVLHATYEQIVRPETVESLGKEAKRSSGLPSDVSDQTPMYGSRLRRGEGLKWAATAISVLVVTLHRQTAGLFPPRPAELLYLARYAARALLARFPSLSLALNHRRRPLSSGSAQDAYCFGIGLPRFGINDKAVDIALRPHSQSAQCWRGIFQSRLVE
jgi:hypothetical protein